MPPIKALAVDYELIAQSMRDIGRETSDYYLDKITGRVIALARVLIAAISKEENEARGDVPEWEESMIPLAREIVLFGSTNFTRIPEAFGRPEHAWMIKFAQECRSPKLKQKAVLSLRGRGSCRRFKEILAENPDDLRRWAVFRSRCWEEKIQGWLESHGILAINARPSRSRAPSK